MNPAGATTTRPPGLLDRWADHGWLRALDAAFAAFLARRSPMRRRC